MIIFSLEGVLADDSHRRHFIDGNYRNDVIRWIDNTGEKFVFKEGYSNPCTCKIFQPDYRAYYDACDKDEPIEAGLKILSACIEKDRWQNIQIWTSRCESTKLKTAQWIYDTWFIGWYIGEMEAFAEHKLKMRPLGNTEPAHVLKERWLDILNVINAIPRLREGEQFEFDKPFHNIDFVFDADPDSIAMWRRRGIFCFECRQK